MSNEEKAKAIIAELNSIARECDFYEYGLPVFSDKYTAKMLDAVLRILSPNGASPAGQERVANHDT